MSLLASVVVPVPNVGAFGGVLLSHISDGLVAVLPYAAALLSFSLGVAFIKGWIGRRKATRLEARERNRAEFRRYARERDPRNVY